MMMGNYFKLALINIFTHRIFAVINVLGLAIGLACCLVIVLYVRYELSFDKHFSNAARIVRIDQVVGEADNFRTPGLLVDALASEVQGVEQAGRFINVETTLSFEGLTFNEREFAYADSQFLQIFDFQWLQGSAQRALNDPASIVLTQALATKYFGNEDPLGKVLRMGEYSVRVTGVIADLPANTHLRFSALASMDLFAEGLSTIGFNLDNWNSSFTTTYALLDEEAEINSVQNQLPALATKHMQPGIKPNVLPLADIYMHASAQMELSPVGSMPRVLIFSAIALCILVVAIINFINLSTARASWRALEVGLRKSIGASRLQIIIQFLGEAVLQVVCAMVLGLMLVEIVLPWVTAITGKTLTLDIWTTPAALAGLLTFTLGLGLLAGFYPAFYLSAFHPVAVLKGQITRGRQASVLRSLLVIVQFSISIAMIIAAGVIYLQIQFVRTVDMGFTYEQVVVLDVPSADIFDANSQWDALRAQLNNHPGVIDSTHSVSTPLRQGADTAAFIYREENGARVSSQDRFVLESVEPAYMETYGLELLSGQWFSASLQSERLATFAPGYEGNPQGSLILNEEAARLLGWSAGEAVGQVLGLGTINKGVVKGVVSNTMASTRQSYQPFIYYVPQEFDYRFGATIAVKIAKEHVPQTLDHIDATWKAFFPGNPVQRYFLEDEIGALYQQERQQMQLSVLSAMMAVLIACFGLYALAAFNAEHRRKEIGVRKVGSSRVDLQACKLEYSIVSPK